MQKTLLFCEQCYDNAASFGEYPLDIYVKICEKFALEKKALQIHVADRHVPVIIQFLEEKDYVVSTHVHYPYILVKPKGVEEISEGVFMFCSDCKNKNARQ